MDPMGLALFSFLEKVNPLHSKTRVLRSRGGGGTFLPPVHSLCSSMSFFFLMFFGFHDKQEIADSTIFSWSEMVFPIFLFRPLDVPKLFALHAEQQTCPCYSVTSMP